MEESLEETRKNLKLLEDLEELERTLKDPEVNFECGAGLEDQFGRVSKAL